MAEYSRPRGLRWRSSTWFVTLVVGIGMTCDLLVYGTIIPVIPFQLERLGHSGVSALTGWLLFAFSAGVVFSTPVISILSEKYNSRQALLLVGSATLIGSQTLFMEAPTYWVMCVARTVQGISSSCIWIGGLALICDSVPEEKVGRQLGIAMTGMSVGLVLGPPIGGALYASFGFRAPFIFGIIFAAIDLCARLLIVERKKALSWELDPLPSLALDVPLENIRLGKSAGNEGNAISHGSVAKTEHTSNIAVDSPDRESFPDAAESTRREPERNLSSFAVLIKLCLSSRANAALFNIFVYGLACTSQEPTLPLHLQSIWGYNSSKVGLLYLAAVVPTLFASPLSGWYADRNGVEWITAQCLALTIPWLVVLVIDSSIALFIIALMCQSLFMAGIATTLTMELASVSRQLDGVGYAHVYGAFNLVFGVGSVVGPVVGGQLYTHVRHGWTAVCLLAAGSFSAALVLSFCYIGDPPLLARFRDRLRHRASSRDSHHPDS